MGKNVKIDDIVNINVKNGIINAVVSVDDVTYPDHAVATVTSDVDGEYTIKRVEMSDKSIRLMPANENNKSYKPIEVAPENNFLIWGVVTWVIKKM